MKKYGKENQRLGHFFLAESFSALSSQLMNVLNSTINTSIMNVMNEPLFLLDYLSGERYIESGIAVTKTTPAKTWY